VSRKDYQRIAGIIARFSRATYPSPTGFVAAQIADGLANVLAIDNPRFDRAKFMAACDVAHWEEAADDAA
jgi:hypothetical protein